MGKTGIAALLAVAAALMIGIGDVLEQRSAQQVTDKPVGTFALFRRLLRDRRWWAGSLVAAAGFGLQAAALGLGSVVLVQALSVTSLLFAMIISATVNHRRITRWQGIWAVLLVAAVTVVVTVGNPQAGTPRGSLQTWTIVAAGHGPGLILCVIGARKFSGSVSALLLGVMSGSLWGLFSVLTKGVVDQLGHGILPLLRTPELYVWAVLGDRRHGLGAVGVSGRPADRVATRGDRRRAHRRIGAWRHRAGRDAEHQRRRPGRTRRVGRGNGRGDGGAGSQPGRWDPGRRREPEADNRTRPQMHQCRS